MPNAKDSAVSQFERILVLGGSGSGKTTQILTLSGRKFVYIFDPAGRASLRNADIEYEEFLPDTLELDMAFKGFNKGAQSDKLGNSKREPSTYMRWATDLNTKHEAGFFKDFSWLCIDSMTLLAAAMMDRQKFINGRYGGIEDLADFRIAGSKIAETFRSICSLPINVYLTAHLTEFQDDKTKKITTQISLPGQAKTMLPMLMNNIWEMRQTSEEKQQYVLLTRSEPRGYQALRTTIAGLPPTVDVTVKDFTRPEAYGIGKILTDAKAGRPTPVPTPNKPTVQGATAAALPAPASAK